jgi:hypothetical protein
MRWKWLNIPKSKRNGLKAADCPGCPFGLRCIVGEQHTRAPTGWSSTVGSMLFPVTGGWISGRLQHALCRRLSPPDALSKRKDPTP